MDYKKLYLDLKDRVKQLNKIGLALSTERDTDNLFEMILDEATKISNAAGCTLYQSFDEKLFFNIIKNEPLKIWQGGISGVKIKYDPINLYLENALRCISLQNFSVSAHASSIISYDARAEGGRKFEDFYRTF